MNVFIIKPNPLASPVPLPSSSGPYAWQPQHPFSWRSPQVDVARPVALAPGGRPVGVGLGALPALFDLLHLPYDQILEPGLELEGLGISSIIIPVITSKLQAARYYV